MFCPNCGTQITNSNQPFCHSCGTKLNASAQPNQPQPNQQQSYNNQAPGQPFNTQPTGGPVYTRNTNISFNPSVPVQPNKSKAWIPILASTAVLAIVAVIVCVVIFGGEKEISNEDKITNTINKFTDYCNDSDLENMFSCFDKTTRKQYDTMLEASEGIFGAIAGFDMPIGSMYELFMGDALSDVIDLTIDINSIDVNGSEAEVEIDYKNGDETGSTTLIMCEEEGEWYIDLNAMNGRLVFLE